MLIWIGNVAQIQCLLFRFGRCRGPKNLVLAYLIWCWSCLLAAPRLRS